MDIATLVFQILTSRGAEDLQIASRDLFAELLKPSTDVRVIGLNSLLIEGARKHIDGMRAESKAA